MKAEAVAPHYFKDIITLFFGSMALAYAVESVNLHRRIALFVLKLVGTSTKWYRYFLQGFDFFDIKVLLFFENIQVHGWFDERHCLFVHVD